MCQSFGILNCSRNIWPKSFFYSRLDIVVTLHGKSPFFFPDVMKRCSFQKHCAGIWFFLYYRKRWKLKMTFLKKNTRKYDIFFKLSEKSVFSKGAALGHDLSCIILNNGIFFPKKWYFFLGHKVRDDLSQEIHRNMIFSVYTYGCYKRCVTSLCQKKSKMVLFRKNTPKGYWRSRLTS